MVAIDASVTDVLTTGAAAITALAVSGGVAVFFTSAALLSALAPGRSRQRWVRAVRRTVAWTGFALLILLAGVVAVAGYASIDTPIADTAVGVGCILIGVVVPVVAGWDYRNRWLGWLGKDAAFHDIGKSARDSLARSLTRDDAITLAIGLAFFVAALAMLTLIPIGSQAGDADTAAIAVWSAAVVIGLAAFAYGAATRPGLLALIRVYRYGGRPSRLDDFGTFADPALHSLDRRRMGIVLSSVDRRLDGLSRSEQPPRRQAYRRRAEHLIATLAGDPRPNSPALRTAIHACVTGELRLDGVTFAHTLGSTRSPRRWDQILALGATTVGALAALLSVANQWLR